MYYRLNDTLEIKKPKQAHYTVPGTYPEKQMGRELKLIS